MSKEEMDWISILMGKTGALAKDCIINEENSRVIFVLERPDAGKAIGRGGETIRQLRTDLGRDVEIIEYSENPEELAKNAIAPVRVKKTTLKRESGKTTILLTVEKKDKGRAIGKGGKVLKKAQMLVKRHFNIDDVKIVSVNETIE
jgi:N utilization substance protein A